MRKWVGWRMTVDYSEEAIRLRTRVPSVQFLWHIVKTRLRDKSFVVMCLEVPEAEATVMTFEGHTPPGTPCRECLTIENLDQRILPKVLLGGT
jgi:hypothetical protein